MNQNIIKFLGVSLFLFYSSLSWAEVANTVFETGTLINLTNGVYEGSATLSDVESNANLGLGTVNGAKGEMVMVDGNAYLSGPYGDALPLSPATKTPFAMLVNFTPDHVFYLHDINSMDDLEKAIDQHLPTPNYFYAMKIEGTFSTITARSFDAPVKPYQPFPQWLKTHQHIFSLHDTPATVVVFKSPDYFANIAMPGYHMHMVTADKKKVGHVFDLKFKDAKVSVETIRDFHLVLPNDAAFQNSNLTVFSDKTMSVMEKNK